VAVFVAVKVRDRLLLVCVADELSVGDAAAGSSVNGLVLMLVGGSSAVVAGIGSVGVVSGTLVCGWRVGGSDGSALGRPVGNGVAETRVLVPVVAVG